MAIDNEELMNDLQRVSVQMRRNRHAHMHRHVGKGGAEQGPNGAPDGAHEGVGPHGHGGPYGHGHGGPHCHGHGHGGPHGHCYGHGIGGHKHHDGSGRHGQNRVLALLVMQDGTSQKDLAYLLGIRPQSLTQALDTLEKGGFIERRQDEADKRVNRVYLTDAGRSRAAKVAEDRKQYAEGMFSMLTEEEKEQLAAILKKINTAYEEESTTLVNLS